MGFSARIFLDQSDAACPHHKRKLLCCKKGVTFSKREIFVRDTSDRLQYAKLRSKSTEQHKEHMVQICFY